MDAEWVLNGCSMDACADINLTKPQENAENAPPSNDRIEQYDE
jgi:hypothetical protein